MPRSRANKMADLGSALEMVNDLVAGLDRLSDASDIGVVVLRLDFLHRMLVSLDVDQDSLVSGLVSVAFVMIFLS